MAKTFIEKGINFECQGSSNCCVSYGNNGFVYLDKKDLSRQVITWNWNYKFDGLFKLFFNCIRLYPMG